MTEQKHTPEPWKIGSQSKDIIYLQGDEPRGELGPSGNWIDCNTADNASRIVACVNACAGISIETLEARKDGGVLKYVDEMAEVIRQRDQLRAALAAIADPYQVPSHGDPSELREYARAALAETEGV